MVTWVFGCRGWGQVMGLGVGYRGRNGEKRGMRRKRSRRWGCRFDTALMKKVVAKETVLNGLSRFTYAHMAKVQGGLRATAGHVE
jgi:hypothetical protein